MIKVHPLLIKDVQKGRHSIIESNDDICQIFMLNIVVSNKQYLIIYVADSKGHQIAHDPWAGPVAR